MQVILLLLLVLLPYISCEEEENARKINLEDIERDNLVSERQSQGRESLEEQQTQHVRPPGIQTLNRYMSITSLPTRGGILYAAYATPSRHREVTPQQEEYTDNEAEQPPSHVQYVTQKPINRESHHVTPVYRPSSVSESSGTYSVSNRLSLLKAITTRVPHAQQEDQAEYIYVPMRVHQQHQKHVANDIQYAGTQPAEESYSYTRSGSSIDEVQPKQQSEEVNYQHQSPDSVNYLQYMPYISRGPTEEQTYIMMVPIPAGYRQSNAKQQVSLSTSQKPISHSSGRVVVHNTNYQPSNVRYIAQPTAPQRVTEYVGTNDIHTDHSTGRTQDIQYADPYQVETYRPSFEKSKQYLYAPKHPEKQQELSRQQQLPKIEYISAQKSTSQQQAFYSTPRVVQAIHVPSVQASKILEPQQPVQQPAKSTFTLHNSPAVDFFYGRDSKSLLESYIPSWVVIQRQKSLQQNFATPVVSGYNTISYSVPHPPSRHNINYFKKRSTEKQN